MTTDCRKKESEYRLKMAVPSPPPPPSILGDSITPSQSGSSLPSLSSTDTNAESNNGDKPWKRASTLEEVRQSAGRWSLAGDSGLLLYFKKFSQNMLLKTHELEKTVDDLVHDTKGMGSKLHNTFNDFLMLSNKQFIENRVYDEEISQDEALEKDTAQQQAKTREQLESEILPRYSEAVNLGFQVLDDAFITVEIKAEEESDDEEGLPSEYVPDPIIEPKDMYASRPLPHLIGTAEFFSDENLGLVEIDDEEDESTKNVKMDEAGGTSESESESETESETDSSEESESSSEEELPKKTTKKEVSDESETEDESDEDLFGESKKKAASSEDSESETEEVNKPKPKLGIQAELAAKLGIKEQAKVEDKNDDDTKSITSKTTIDNESIKNLAVDSSVSKAKKDKKHRSRTKSSDDHKHHHHNKKKTSDVKPAKTPDEESDEDLFGESKQKNSYEDDGLFGKKGGLFSGGETLFDQDHQQEDDNLFGDNDESVRVEITEDKAEEPTSPAEIKPRTRTTSSGKKIPVGGVSLFGDSTPLFGSGSSISKEAPIKEEVSKTKTDNAKKPPPIVKGLFGDGDGDDELFGENSKSNLLQEPPKQRRKKTLELFDDAEDSLFQEKAQSSKPVSENEKMENAKSNKTSITGDKGNLFEADDKTQIKSEPAIKKSESKPKVVSLFDDDGGNDDDDDWFGKMNTTTKTTPEAQKNNTTSPNVSKKEDDSLFNEPKPSTNNIVAKKKEEPKKPSKSKKVVSLFEDDEEDFLATPSNTKTNKQKDEIQKAGKSKETIEKPKEKKHPKTKSFIDDSGNGLFGDDQEDLFNATQKTTSKKEENKVVETEEKKVEKKIEKKPKQKSAISFLDGDDDDDGFFSVPKKKQESKKEKTSEKETPTKTSAKEEENKPQVQVSSSDTILSDEDDLFTTKPKGDKNNKIISDNIESEAAVDVKIEVDNTKAENEEEPVQKPKRPPGAVSLFGGIDPFAAKNKLRSPDKDHGKTITASKTIADDDSDGIFGKKSVQEKQTSSEDKKLIAKKPDEPKEESIKEPMAVAKDDSTQKAKAETPKKIKPTIAFNPATMVPGATPPLRNKEEPVLSFDRPATVTTLHHANKERVRVQKKRRPPSRHFLQNAGITANGPSDAVGTNPSVEHSDDIFSKPVDGRVSSAENTQDLLQNNSEKKSSKKPIGHVDIFSDDDDELFSTKQRGDHSFSSTETSKTEKDPISSDIFTTLKRDVTPSKGDVTPSVTLSKDKPKDEEKGIGDGDLFSGDKKAKDSIFDSDSMFSDTKKAKPQATDNPKNIVDDIFNPVTWKDKGDSVVEHDDDIFKVPDKVTSPKTTTSKIAEKTDETAEDLFDSSEPQKAEKEVAKEKKNKKEDKNVFKDDIDDGIFSSEKTKKDDKKETTKKTKKSSRVVTDDDLFGDTGSIFSDIPAKSKEKKKKKSSAAGKDLFTKTDEDIFASGGEKKAKTKKKTEKTTKTKTTKTATSEQNAPNIFDDPLNALGAD